MNIGKYDAGQLAVDMPRMMTIRERLTERKLRLEENLADVNRALEMLTKSPEFEGIHDAITKAGM